MDSSKYHFSTEGCSSSESGWTMYIDSPMQEDDVDCNNGDDDDDDDNNHYRNSNKYTSVNDREDNKEESDDSMASDASSGPSHLQHKRANGEGTHSNIPSTSKQGKVDQFRKFFSFKKTNEKEKKSAETSTKYKHRNDAQKKCYK